MKCLRWMKKSTLRRVFSVVLAVMLVLVTLLALRGGQGLRNPLFCAILLVWIILLVLYLTLKDGQERFRFWLDRLMESQDPQDVLMEGEARGEITDRTDRETLEKLALYLQESTAANTLKIEAELHALQNQINPHFLYNTLEIIRSRAMLQGNEDVSEMVESLAMQFRYCINNSGEMAALQQELDHVHNYLLIQRYRFGDHFHYEEFIDKCDERLPECRLPVLTLQPIVENALIHGVNPRVEDGHIMLRVQVISDRLEITVEDDGIGIPELELQKIRRALREGRSPERRQGRKSSGIAMYNVNSRIRLYSGDRYGVDLTSTVGVGTSVKVTLPLMYSDEESRANERRGSLRGEFGH